MKPAKRTLLIVEDDEDERVFFKRSFERLNTQYAVRLARGGNEAIAYLKGEGEYADRDRFEFPSYIITDLQMPDGDGFAVLEFLKNNPAFSVIPVVMVSSSDDEDDIRHAYFLGASSYLVKPPNLVALQALLKTIHAYWIQCEVPGVDIEGYALPTESRGKAGERFPIPKRPAK